jgi:hypothetical protein
VPKEVFGDQAHTYGQTSFHNQNYTEIKDLIQNNPLKEILLEKIKKQIVEDHI